MASLPPAEPAYILSLDGGYLRSFEATVRAMLPEGVVLSSSLFYPTGGGQQADHGFLSLPDGTRVEVVDVRRVSGAVVHRLEKGGTTKFRIGMTVHGEIDWSRRYTHMRLHTGQHLLSALVFDRLGICTTEAEMVGKGGSIDLERPLPAEESLAGLESEANERYFSKPVRVESQIMTRTEFEASPGRSSAKSLPRAISSVRVILIEGVDRCACGGTHVRSTGEVGPVRVFRGKAPAGVPYRLSFELLEDRAGPESVS